jgi:hypothetical protein
VCRVFPRVRYKTDDLPSLQTDTKESKWDMPDELLLVLEKVEKEGQTSVQPAGVYVFGEHTVNFMHSSYTGLHK